MTKREALEKFLDGKKPVDFYGINAPDFIDVIANNNGKIVIFRKMYNHGRFTGDEFKTSVCYQSTEVNNNGEYPIIEIVVQKCGNKRVSYKFVMGWLGSHVW